MAADAETAAIAPKPGEERELAVSRAREADLERRIDSLQAALLRAQTEVAEIHAAAAESERERAELDMRLVATGDRLRAAEDWIRTIHASKSWRLTTPLRRLAAALRG